MTLCIIFQPKPEWMSKVKKPENPLIGIGKRPTAAAQKPAEKKPDWAQSKLKKGGGSAPAEKEKSEKRPDWSARSLKKSEKPGHGGDDDQPASRRQDWREGLKSGK